jgi:hypothetical protein
MAKSVSTIEDPRIVEAVGRVEEAVYRSKAGGPQTQSHFRRGSDDRGDYVIVEVVCKFRFAMDIPVPS